MQDHMLKIVYHFEKINAHMVRSLIQKKMHTWSDMRIQATDNWMVTITEDEKRAMCESVVLYVHIRTTDVSMLPLNCKTN